MSEFPFIAVIFFQVGPKSRSRTLKMVLFVDFPSVPDIQCDDNQLLIFNCTDQTIVSNSISPISSFISCQSLPDSSWIINPFKILANPRSDHSLCIFVQFFDFFDYFFSKTDDFSSFFDFMTLLRFFISCPGILPLRSL